MPMKVNRLVWEQDGVFYIGLFQVIRGEDCSKYRVTYGKQIWTGLSYAQAAQKLGEAIMHRAACEGNIQ